MEILYEDNHLIAVNKPFGMLSQADYSGDVSVFDWVKEDLRVRYNKPGNVYVGLLHRLDRPAGGVMLLAKTSKAATRMSKQFEERKLKKIYYIITEHIPPKKSGILEHYLKQKETKNIMRAYAKPIKGAQAASLSSRVLKNKGPRSLVEIVLQTGRKHQIRVQMASIGAVIVGDVKYGESRFLPDKSIALLAKELSFVHPTSKELLKIEAPFPQKEVWEEFI